MNQSLELRKGLVALLFLILAWRIHAHWPFIRWRTYSASY